MSNNVKLQVLLRAVDQASRPFKSIRTASKSLSGDIRETQKSLRELNGHASRIEGFRKTSAQLAVTGHALEKARQEAEALATQFKNTERPTRAQAKVLESAKRAAEDLQAKYNRLTDSVKRQQRELAAVGINTRNLAHDEQGLKNRISETTAQLNRQRDALARVSAQQAKLNAVKQRYQAGKELAGNMASVGAAGVGIAAAGTMASRNRLEASVAPSLAGIKIPHIDQSQESDAKFLTRLAERNGSEVSVKMGKLLFLKAGQGVTASGKKIPQITITRSDGDRHHFAIADRGAYTGVTAKWLHTKDPKPQKQKVKLKRKKKEKHLRALEHPKAKPVRQKKAPKVPEAREGEYMAGEADNVFALTTVYATKAQAMRAAQAKWDKLQRGVAEFSISLATGRADIYTETPVKVSGFKRVIDEQDWTITKVTHLLNNSGFTTSLELEVRLSDVEYETEDDE